MMSELDPHSVYFPPVDLKAANEELAGNFEGIGVEFNIFNDTVNVVYVMPNGPSDKAGLQIGDKIIKANDSSLRQQNISGRYDQKIYTWRERFNSCIADSKERIIKTMQRLPGELSLCPRLMPPI